ncbi:MAG: DNA polymerase III subunit alpha, partial [Planctomycetes bacterium]|nr:DNA polymerase III subunit alpha [Planctomycetota bacterium]
RRRGARGRAPADEDPAASLLAGPTEGVVALADDPLTLARLAGRVDLRALLARPGPRAAEGVLRAAAARLGAPLVASPDADVLEPGDRDLHALLGAIRARRTVADDPPRAAPLPRPAEVERTFADAPEALAEARRLAEACALDLLGARPILPAPRGDLALRARAGLERARAAGRLRGEAYDARLRRELAVFEATGLGAYVETVADVVDLARARGVPVAARGSAAGSLVLHALGVTQVDPVALGLLFERLLHEERPDLPDVDLDLPSDRRDEVIDAVFARFGPERVAMVAAYQTFQRRSAVRAGLLALGAPRRDVERHARQLPPDDLPPLPGAPSCPLVPAWLVPPARRALAPAIERLIGLPRHLSVHPGGVAIADGPIEAHVPLERAPGGRIVAQLDLRAAGQVGLVKLDLLGNRTLSELQATLGLLADRPGDPLAARLAREGLAALPEDDPAALAALDRAETIGCAQVESPAVRAVLARVPVRRLADLTAVLAVVRPGAAAGQAKERFVRRARGEAPTPALDPRLADVLAPTHGVLLFEEQLIEVLARLGGLTRAAADRLRVDVAAARDDPAALERLARGFVGGAAVDEATARAAFAAVARHAACSFNQAHAASTARLAAMSMALRVRFPVESACALLEHHGGAYPLRAIGADLVRRGVALRGPDVNASAAACTVERGSTRADDAARVGLGLVKHLARATLERLLRTRAADGPFDGVVDLLRRVRPSRRELEALVRSGACDRLAPLTPATYPFAHEALLEALGPGRPDPGGVPAELPAPAAPAPADRATLARFAALVRARDELRFLELSVAAHPVALLRDEAAAQGCVPLACAADLPGRRVSVAAVLSASHRVAARGGQLWFLTLDDETGLLEAVVPPGVMAAVGARLTTPGPYLVTGRMAQGGAAPHLVVSRLTPFHERQGAYA